MVWWRKESVKVMETGKRVLTVAGENIVREVG